MINATERMNSQGGHLALCGPKEEEIPRRKGVLALGRWLMTDWLGAYIKELLPQIENCTTGTRKLY